MSENKKIAILGAGHIGKAIFRGLLKSGVRRKDIYLSNKSGKNGKAVKNSEIIFICVKPKVVKEVFGEIKSYLTENKIIISVAACASLNLLEKYAGTEKYKMVRIMPNIPVAYNLGVIGILFNTVVNDEEKKNIRKTLSKLGILVDCRDDEQLDRLSMVSGCGTGYVGYFMDNLENVAKTYGFNRKKRKQIVLATFEGAIRHLMETNISFSQLVEEVATPGGITEEVINHLKKKKFFENLKSGVDRGYDKVQKIAKILEGGE